jgi:hypothetical protein
MTTHRRYEFTVPGPWEHPEGHDTVNVILQRRCKQYWWYNDPQVTGEALGILSFSFTVSARDQWWCHGRAMKLAGACFLALGLPETRVPDPVWHTLPAHSNRGRFRIPTRATS